MVAKAGLYWIDGGKGSVDNLMIGGVSAVLEDHWLDFIIERCIERAWPAILIRLSSINLLFRPFECPGLRLTDRY